MKTTSNTQPLLKPLPLGTKGIRNLWQVLYRWLAVGRTWEVCEDWKFTTPDDKIIQIPKGFVSDGASIPRILRFILSPTGLMFIPSLIHDYAFAHDHLLLLNKDGKPEKYLDRAGKKKWDDMFYDLSMQIHGIRIIAQVSKLALKIGSHTIWKKYQGTAQQKKNAEALLKVTGFLNVVTPFIILGLIITTVFF